MNKEYINQSAFGVDFLDVESGEKIISITEFGGELIALTNRGSIYEIIGQTATRINPSLNVVEVDNED
jgi:hypothetical protein